MEQPVAVVVRSTRPRPANFYSSLKTRLINQTADSAVCMMPSRRLNQLVPSQLATSETVILIHQNTRRRRRGLSTGCWLVLVAVPCAIAIVLFIFFLMYRRATTMRWMGEEPDNKQLRKEPAEKTYWEKPLGKCVLPTYPEHGTYVITNAPGAKPGDRFDSVTLTFVGLPGYEVLGKQIVTCVDGLWSDSIPKCVRFCKLDSHPSVHYHCRVNGSIEGHRACNAYEPSGTVVWPECNSPNYYSAGALPVMRCIDGSWDQVVVCSAECGRVTPNGVDLMTDSRSAKVGELPWHVGIYRKTKKPYLQICGGSLISNKLVISAAHCFWNDVSKLLPASKFAVAGGKIYRPWNNQNDVHAQKSDVKDIKIPVRFQGSAANFQDDIAVVILETAFVYNPFVRPVCLNFDVNFDKIQLQPGKSGKVAGWGLTSENGLASQILKVVELPFVDTGQCIDASPPDFKEYITSDKMCAGYGNGTAPCKGDSGGGLAFPEFERGTHRYYLRGIVSATAKNDNLCNSHAITAFTQILIHEHFVREYL